MTLIITRLKTQLNVSQWIYDQLIKYANKHNVSYTGTQNVMSMRHFIL